MADNDKTDSTPFGDGGLPWRRRFDPKSLIGWEVGEKYKITRHLGSGGFGEVYEGYNVNLPEQHVVIKFLKQVHSRERFEKEAKILCVLDHPNICRIIEYMPNEQAVIIPYIKGNDCGQILDEIGPLDEATVLTVARSVTSAMAYAHKMNIAHRDIKPSNIMIDHHHHVYLIDFGIAKQMDATTFTRTGQQPMTPQFAAPERLSRDPNYNPILSDIFEIGSTIFKLATNCSPYEFTRWHDAGIESDPAVRRLSGQMKHIIRKATQRDPTDRYGSVDEMARDFQALQKVYTRRNRMPYVIVLILVAILAAAGYIFRADLVNVYHRVTASSPAVTDSLPVQPAQTPPADTTKSEPPPDNPPVTQKPKPVTQSPARQTENKKPTPAPETKPAVTKPEPEPRQDVAEDTAETNAEDEPPVATTPPPPPPPATYQLVVTPQPPDAVVYVDGQLLDTGRPLEVDTGIHIVYAIHPDYPLSADTLRLSADATLAVDLPQRYADRPQVMLVIGCARDLENRRLQLRLNGRTYGYTDADLPAYDRSVASGPWMMEFLIVGDSETAGIDSAVVFPYAETLKQTFTGHSWMIDFGRPSWRGQAQVPFTIYCQPAKP